MISKIIIACLPWSHYIKNKQKSKQKHLKQSWVYCIAFLLLSFLAWLAYFTSLLWEHHDGLLIVFPTLSRTHERPVYSLLPVLTWNRLFGRIKFSVEMLKMLKYHSAIISTMADTDRIDRIHSCTYMQLSIPKLCIVNMAYEMYGLQS